MFSILLSALVAVASATEYTVQVGPNGTLTYSPNNMKAMAGDVITFQFNPKNHTVTQGTYDDPCSPLPGGIDSGFNPVPDPSAPPPPFRLTINDTNPLYFYCRQTGHCQKAMVMGINTDDFDEYQQNAMNSGNSTNFTLPAPPTVVTLTATITLNSADVYTTSYASWPGASPNPTPAPSPATITISVGGSSGLVYSPPTATANIGDVVVWDFGTKNHTVTQSTFLDPCESLAKSSNGSRMGFDSGFMPPSDSNPTPTFNITIKDTSPIWYYCRQVNHCQSGMVGSLNAPVSGNYTFDMFKKIALHSSNSTGTANAAGNTTGSGGEGGSSSKSGAGRAAVTTGWGVSVIALAVALYL